jgi:hypothetical protein
MLVGDHYVLRQCLGMYRACLYQASRSPVVGGFALPSRKGTRWSAHTGKSALRIPSLGLSSGPLSSGVNADFADTSLGLERRSFSTESTSILIFLTSLIMRFRSKVGIVLQPSES